MLSIHSCAVYCFDHKWMCTYSPESACPAAVLFKGKASAGVFACVKLLLQISDLDRDVV